MKKALSIMLTLVMIVSMFSMMTITGSAAISYKAVKAATAPTLDGEKDSGYGSNKFTFVGQNDGASSDHYAYVCWSGVDLYVFFHVVDSTEPNYKQFGANDLVGKSYMTDCVEVAIGFDGHTGEDVSSNNKYGYNAQIRFNPYYTSTTHDEAYECNQGIISIPYGSKNMKATLDVKGGKTKAFFKKTSDGYNVEIKLNTEGKLSEAPCIGLQVCDADVKSETATNNNNGGYRNVFVLNKNDHYFPLNAQYELTLEGYSLADAKKDELNAIESSKAAVSASRAAASASRAASLAALSASKAALSSKSSSKTSGATSSAASDATSSGSTSTETSGTTSTESTASTNEEVGGTTVGDNTDGGDADNTIGADSGNVEEGGSSLLWIIIVAGAGLLVLAAAAVVLFVVLKKKKGVVAEEVVADDAQQEELDFGDEE